MEFHQTWGSALRIYTFIRLRQLTHAIGAISRAPPLHRYPLPWVNCGCLGSRERSQASGWSGSARTGCSQCHCYCKFSKLCEFSRFLCKILGENRLLPYFSPPGWDTPSLYPERRRSQWRSHVPLNSQFWSLFPKSKFALIRSGSLTHIALRHATWRSPSPRASLDYLAQAFLNFDIFQLFIF